ncbi:hypothetical protein C8R45DRAFT_1027003 [Mycena sanguinolenta]|nr:hypothetical protein C8R45DRAFT_1027003 [Mycena sanguinolenta]
MLEKQKHILGNNHAHTLRTMGDLANTYSDLGKHHKSQEPNIEKQKETPVHNYPDTLHTMGNLAATSKDLSISHPTNNSGAITAGLYHHSILRNLLPVPEPFILTRITRMPHTNIDTMEFDVD